MTSWTKVHPAQCRAVGFGGVAPRYTTGAVAAVSTMAPKAGNTLTHQLSHRLVPYRE
jgi:hypothetical protein